MWQFAIFLTLLARSSEGLDAFSNRLYSSAASPSQIRFAIENKYDDTGPGATKPEYAYKTFKILDDALVAYLNDPDTKLPEYERMKALNYLNQNRPSYQYNFIEDLPRRVDAFTGNQHKIVPMVLSRYNKYDLDSRGPILYENLIHQRDPIKRHKEQAVKTSRLSISHFNREEPETLETFHYPIPRVESTANLRSALEVRDGNGAVHGYYTVSEPDGAKRTVHYQSDAKRGIHSSVQRLFSFDASRDTAECAMCP